MVELDGDEQHQIAQELVHRARPEGVDPIGPGGLLPGLTKTVPETALEKEIARHLGNDKHDPTGRPGNRTRWTGNPPPCGINRALARDTTTSG
jgi:hypothetical protein